MATGGAAGPPTIYHLSARKPESLNVPAMKRRAVRPLRPSEDQNRRRGTYSRPLLRHSIARVVGTPWLSEYSQPRPGVDPRCTATTTKRSRRRARYINKTRESGSKTIRVRVFGDRECPPAGCPSEALTASAFLNSRRLRRITTPAFRIECEPRCILAAPAMRNVPPTLRAGGYRSPPPHCGPTRFHEHPACSVRSQLIPGEPPTGIATDGFWRRLGLSKVIS